MSSQRDSGPKRASALKNRILSTMAAAPACIVASAIVAIPVAAGAATPSIDALSAQAQGTPAADRATTDANAPGSGAVEGAKQWWANGWRRPWGNWNNWHNWPNWNNWHNWGW